MKLNGWQRIGIVASVAWAIGAYVHTFDTEYSAALGIYNMIYDDCVKDSSGQVGGSDHCKQTLTASLDESYVGSREAAALFAVVPIPLGWGFVYLVLFLVRWIKRGFSSRPSDSTTG